MVFTSHIFIFYFLPLTLLVYYLLPVPRNFFLLIMSYIFYGWWNPWFASLMLFASYANYVCGHVIATSPVGSVRRKRALVASIVISLTTLGFFKYFMFFENNLNAMLDVLGAGTLPVIQITLPIGISFFIFQSLSYPIDVYRGDSPPVRNFFDFACFVALFPQLIAGPIVRYNTIAEQLVQRDHTMEKFTSGVALFILGFAKKILLANQMGGPADAVFSAESPAMLDAWFGVVAYAFQIYFDFSAYSDMAIGLGRMFGFEFPRNFNAPYLSDSITDFWRRWHISLSTFLRDYLYIPLGGNRHGERRTYINLTIVMLLGGLWHGANWTFVIWGAFHGLLLAFERWRGKESVYSRLPRPLRVGITFVLVLFSWVLFRSVDISTASAYFKAMLGLASASGGSVLLDSVIYTRGNLIVMALCALLAVCGTQAHDWVEKLTVTRVVLLIGVFVLALMTMFVQAFNPFLYFQF
ncbi:MAG: MBOAT family protein [Candidatus Hydrogenedentes bacterium]|nr:MBOAT family protein [Candidatus Hydrogenedentota bacterium]